MDKPPPKPPRTKSRAEQAKNPVRQVQPPKPPMKKKKIVKRPKGDAERKKKEVEAKLAEAKVVKKIPVSKMDIDDIVNSKKHSNTLERAERGILIDIANGDISRVYYVSPADVKFYKKNHEKDFDDMTPSQRSRMNSIIGKVNHNAEPSVKRDIRKAYRDWKEINKDKKMTEKAAISSFANFVKDKIFLAR